MKVTICALNAEFPEAKDMLSDNRPLFRFGTQLSKLKSINQRLTSLSTDIFYAMYQAVTLKASPEAISLGGGFMVGGILASLDFNDNNIISGITNGIPSPSSLLSVVKKSYEDTSISIAGFVCKYP